MLVVCLVEEDILAITTFCRPVFQNPLLAYAVFSAQPLPIDGTHFHRVRFELSVLASIEPHFGCRIALAGP